MLEYQLKDIRFNHDIFSSSAGDGNFSSTLLNGMAWLESDRLGRQFSIDTDINHRTCEHIEYFINRQFIDGVECTLFCGLLLAVVCPFIQWAGL